MEKKRTHTSSAVKQKYNQKVYDRVSVYVPKEMASAFKAKCVEKNIPQAQVIKNAIKEFLEN